VRAYYDVYTRFYIDDELVQEASRTCPRAVYGYYTYIYIYTRFIIMSNIIDFPAGECIYLLPEAEIRGDFVRLYKSITHYKYNIQSVVPR